MIDDQTAEEVRRLLTEPGATHRSVAAALGVSRACVGRIARGEWRQRRPLIDRGPNDPTPEEILQRARDVRRAGGGELVLPAIAALADLAEVTAANLAYADRHAWRIPLFNCADILGAFELRENADAIAPRTPVPPA